MHKLFNTLLIGVATIFLSSAYSVYAAEHQIFKCTKHDNSVVFQDFACSDVRISEASGIKEPGYSSNTGLRDYEKVVLRRSAKRLAREQKLRAMLQAARIKHHKRLESKN